MLLTADRPQVFREYRVHPRDADRVAKDAVEAARALRERGGGCEAWAVHLSHDRLRVVAIEAWRSSAAYLRAGLAGDLQPVAGVAQDAALYQRAGTTGVDPTPVADPSLGVVVIDVVRLWRPLVRPVSGVNLRNGRAFAQQPGCISTTVLRAQSAGRIATYARWRSTQEFLAAFSTTTGTPVDSTAAAARMTRGLVKTDYHAYDLLDADEGEPR